MRALALMVAIAACAPRLDGPVEAQRTVDRDDADQLAAALAELPGAVRAHVTLHRPVRDPLTGATTSPAASALIVIDDRADPAAVVAAARRLVHAAVPEIAEPAIAVEIGASRPELARVGPFTVAAGDRPALVATLAVLLAAVAGLAGWLAWRYRR
jgi:type III secretory pathway lipoprotein EscJ